MRRFLAHVVVDAIDLMLIKCGVHDFIQLYGRFKVVPKGLFYDHPGPAVAFGCHPLFAQLPHDYREEARGCGQIVQTIGRPALLFN